VVDGSKNPQNIPDALAYSHFFTAVAAHPNPTPQEQGRQNAQLTALQLAAADSAALTGLLANFRVQLDQIESAFFNADAAPSQLTTLQTRKTALVATTRASLQQALTPAGASQVDQYVQTRVKTHIVIYGGTM
jgi:large exoprotein involved in heme utilization and adhesion